MADCGSLADATAAESAGADIAERCTTPICAEGRIHTPADAAAAMAAGAFTVCVGTAITHPSAITHGSPTPCEAPRRPERPADTSRPTTSGRSAISCRSRIRSPLGSRSPLPWAA